LVLIVGLFAVAVGTGGRAGTGDASSGRGGLVAVLHGWLGGSAGVSRADLSAPDCPPSPAGKLAVDGHCVVAVAARGSGTRQLRLRADGPLSVTAPVPGQDYTA